MQTIATGLQIILALCNIIIIAYGLYKFLGRPHATLEQRIAVLENEVQEIKRGSEKTEDRTTQTEETIEVIQTSMLALIEFEIQFCISHGELISDELKKAKDELHYYLAKKK